MGDFFVIIYVNRWGFEREIEMDIGIKLTRYGIHSILNSIGAPTATVQFNLNSVDLGLVHGKIYICRS
jgi:hypothetical protein